MKEPGKKDYVVTTEFWDGPVLRQVGDPISLSASQAKYMMDRVQEPTAHKGRLKPQPPGEAAPE